MESSNDEPDWEDCEPDQSEGKEINTHEAVKRPAHHDEEQAEHSDEAISDEAVVGLANYIQDVISEQAEHLDEWEAGMDVVLAEGTQGDPEGSHDLVVSGDISTLDSRSIWRLFESTKRSAIFHIDQYIEFREVSRAENESEESGHLEDGNSIKSNVYLDVNDKQNFYTFSGFRIPNGDIKLQKIAYYMN
jgi:hypothetical protein